MPIQKIDRETTTKTAKKKTVAYGGAAKALASSDSSASHAKKIISGTDVATCPYCGQAMRR